VTAQEPLPPTERQYYLRPPCAGRLVLTRWAAAGIVFALIWLLGILQATIAWSCQAVLGLLRGRAPAAASLRSSIVFSTRRSLYWLRTASGWDR
jgi:uncharacterized SAM-binding protein YcdF (DUF218 family)